MWHLETGVWIGTLLKEALDHVSWPVFQIKLCLNSNIYLDAKFKIYVSNRN